MAFHIKSTTKFKILIGTSALAVSSVAALFSISGVSALFKGSWMTIVAMMGILEFAKIIVASYVARFWKEISKTLRLYFTIAIIVLMTITSAGIFGYLSEAYQSTKGNYDITEQESQALTAKKKIYEEQIERYRERVNILNSFRAGQESRLDSLYSKNMTVSARRVEENIKRNDVELQSLNSRIDAVTDSVNNISNQLIVKQSINVKGELGPLKFIADAFGTNMDTVVKYLILMLIFVFDPLAVLLFVSLSIMIRKESKKEKFELPPTKEVIKDVLIKQSEDDESPEEKELNEVVSTLNHVEEVNNIEKDFSTVQSTINSDLTIDDTEKKIDEPVPEVTESMVNIESTGSLNDENLKTEVHNPENEHQFYHGNKMEDSQNIPPAPATQADPSVDWHTANWKKH